MKAEKLLSISPLDGRYSESVVDLRGVTSEFGLIKFRVIVEIKWFIHLSRLSNIRELPKLTIKEISYLNDLIDNFGEERNASISRELTKIYQENIRGSLKELYNQIENKNIKGEIILVIHGK